MLGGTELCYAVLFFFGCHRDARLTAVGANNSFILSAQEMNHGCNLIRLCHNLALRAAALFPAPVFVGTVSGLCLPLRLQRRFI